MAKSFDKEDELAQLKSDGSKLDREISIKIHEKQMKQHDAVGENVVELKEAPFIGIEKSLLPKREITNKKVKGLRT